jgi:hypothetical protein
MAKLKIGVLVDDLNLPKFQAEILRELQKSDWCEIALFVKKQKSYNPYHRSKRFALYRFLQKFDAKVFGKNTPYLAPVSIEEILKQSDLLEVITEESDCFDEVSDAVIRKISAFSLDVLLNFGFKYITDDLLHAAKYGIWEFRSKYKPAGFWEVVENIPYTEVTLERVGSALDTGYILDTFKTVTHQKSMRKNYEQLMWRSHMLMVRNLERVAEQGDAYFDNKKTVTYFYHQHPVENYTQKKFFDFQFGFTDDLGAQTPSNFQTIRAVWKLTGKYLKFSARKFFKMDRWIILYSENREGKISPDFGTYKRIPLPSNDHFQADPFMFDDGDKSYLFYEELDYKTLKGYLLVSEYDEETKSFTNPREILRKPYHLSYPNIFLHEGKYYMIPETHENETVDLYEAEEFPVKWKKVRTMLSGLKAVDATLYQKEGYWWMFVNIAVKEGFSLNDELYIYYCKDFRTDEWQPHKLNPVVTDVTTARPAGHLLAKEGKLFRPAQDCSGVYGRGLVINEILKLTPTEYHERVAQHIRADFADDLVAVHTFNHSKRFSVIDAIKSL